MRKLTVIIALLFLVQGTRAQTIPSSGTWFRELLTDSVRIIDVGVAVSDVQTIVRTDSLSATSDTLTIISEPQLVWRSEGVNVADSASVDHAMQPGRAARRQALLDKGIYQWGNMKPDYFVNFHYYVFRFEYPSIDADGKPVMLSAIASCPPKEAASSVNNIIIGTHVTITADYQRPSAQIRNFEQDDWGMILSLGGTGKFLFKEDIRTGLVIGAPAGMAVGVACCFIPFVGWVVGPTIIVGSIVAETFAIEQAHQSTSNPAYNCNLVIMPDYEGYGLTSSHAHPYLYQELTARQCVDAARYGRYLYEHDTELEWLRVPLRSRFRTLSCGYSQGGSVAMAVQRFVEQNGLTEELHFSGSICGDGPYDPIATLMYYVRQDLSGQPMSLSVVLPLIVKGMLDTNPYMLGHKAEQYFRPQFLETGIMDWIASKRYTTGDIDDKWRIYHRDHPEVQDYSRAMLRDVMNDECYAYFTKLYQDNKDTYTSAAGVPLPKHRGLMEDLHLALASNDLTSGWVPQHSLRLFHSRGDKVVPYDNAQRAQNAFGSKVMLEDAPNGLDHMDSGKDFFRGDSNLQLALDRITSSRLNDYVSEIAGNSWKSSESSETIIKNSILVDGKPVDAEYTVLSNSTVALGTGRNTCTSQYISGRVTVPSTITVEESIFSSKTYRVTQIMPLAFRLCTQIETVVVKEGITHIGDFAFIGCGAIKEVELPSTVKSIGSGAFVGISKLEIFTCKAPTPPVWDYQDVFFLHENVTGNNPKPHFRQGTFLNVPADAAQAYLGSTFTNADLGWTTAEGWGTAFLNINGSALENYRLYDPLDLWDLHRIANNPGRYGKVKQLWVEADINMKDSVWTTPIGDTPENVFSAAVHGQGHTITDLIIRSEGVGGFIGYYNGPSISGLRLKHGEYTGTVTGGIVGITTADCRIDSSLVQTNVVGSQCAGGIVGQAKGKIRIDRCVVDRITIYTHTQDGDVPLAGIAGQADDATITNCAVIGSVALSDRTAPFVNKGKASVDYSYASSSSFTGYTPPANITLGKHVIFTGQPLSIVDYTGKKLDLTYDQAYFQSIYPASILGFDGWAYNHGYYPLPDCLVSEWPARPNHAVYGSATMAKTTVNVLTPDEDIPSSAWCDLSEMGFRHYRFKASQLWIDRTLSNYGRAEQLPLGLSRQITAEQGFIIEDTLYAEFLGTEPVKAPVYKMNEANEFVLDDNGNRICVDSLLLYDRMLWKETVRPLSLPYSVALPSNCTLYQPTRVYDVNGETTALFERVRDNYVEAFRPYLLVIHSDSVPLGTLTRAVCPEQSTTTMYLGDYEYVGTMTPIGNTYARSNNIYMVEDERHWLLTQQSDDLRSEVPPFGAYFHATGKNPAKRITMTLEDDNPVISVGDFYFTINTETTEQTEGTEQTMQTAAVSATLSGYHGHGGNVVVPSTAPYVYFGQERQVPVTSLDANIFTQSTALLWSIDLSQCTQLQPVTIDRTAKDNPFYKVDPRTIIYLPEGKLANNGENPSAHNVVVGTECQSLALTDGWDFRPPYNFHAQEATYDRTLYASKQKDGSYKSMTYSLCLPFSVDLQQMWEAGNVSVFRLYFYTEDQKMLFSYDDPLLDAGKAHVIRVNNGSVPLAATDVDVLASPVAGDEIATDDDFSMLAGTWNGTFSRIGNEEAAKKNVCTFNSNNNRWCRIRSDEGRFRNAWAGAFRAFFVPTEEFVRNSYPAVFQQWVQGDDDPHQRIDFPSDFFDTDTDFSGYTDIDLGIEEVVDNGQWSVVSRSAAWHTLDGRRLDSKPTAKGMYIYKGKVIVVK